jgi:uncharacterized damage-inducible protein DinB
MKETLLQFARYNAWANKRIIEALLKLAPEDLDKEIVSSFPSLRKTVYHIWSAEFIWLQRLQLIENPVWIQGNVEGNFEQACQQWQEVSEALVEYAKNLEDEAYTKIVAYKNMAGKHFETPVFGMLQHTFNHSTYHRGQLVTMLRQAGETTIPNTDLIGFLRSDN